MGALRGRWRKTFLNSAQASKSGSAGADEFPEEVKKVKKERVPHRQEGGERPVVLAIDEVIDAGGTI